jgi:UDP-glucose 4-epimerase
LRNAPTRYFMLDMIPTILGFDPLLQLIDQDDLINAIIQSLKSKVRGIFNLAGPDVAPLSRIIKSLNRQSIAIPQSLFRLFMATSFWSRRSSFPLGEIDHLKYSCIVDTSRAESELQFKPQKRISTVINDLQNEYKKKSQAS